MARTRRADEQLMDELEKTGIPALGLLGAKVVDIGESQRDNYASLADAITKMDKKMDQFISSQESTNASVTQNTSDIKANREAITEIKVKDAKSVAIISGVSASVVAIGNFIIKALFC